jgi:ubiquinone biosynthesis protein UbiJ
MDPLATLFRPLASILNRNIAETTRARELCRRLDGKSIAVRVRNSALAVYFEFSEGLVALKSQSDVEPDAVITGTLLSLARLAGKADDTTVGDESFDLTGDARVARHFRELLDRAKPDVEEEFSRVIGDVSAHRLGEIARGLKRWSQEARATMGANIREYLQEESRDAPSRYEVERFTKELHILRDDVARAEARLDRLEKSD